ncbi:MAG: MarR family transcriptional regulator [Spirochaetota bacterium]
MTKPDEGNPIVLLGELFPRLLKATLGDFITTKTREHNLNQTHIKTLIVLLYTVEASMSQLGMKIGLEKGSVTSVVNSLIQRKLVTRTRSIRDKRKWIVKLTEPGIHVAEECRTAMQKHIHQRLCVLDIADQHMFYHSLTDLDAVIRKIEQLENQGG